jgi:hypothetical protein
MALYWQYVAWEQVRPEFDMSLKGESDSTTDR